MTEPRSATILAFPRPVAPPPSAEDADLRLRRALAALDAALATQRQAVDEWRAGLQRLHTGVAELGGSLQRYHAVLGSLGQQVAGIGEQAHRLQGLTLPT